MLHTRCDVLFMALGTRGDVQYMLKAGKLLKTRFHARVRIATHPNFQSLVEDAGLEYFNAGGDPDFIMEYRLENPGLIPKISTIKSGRVGRIRVMFREMLEGYWAACVDVQGTSAAGNTGQIRRPFIADVIIANVPNQAHIHCAERLGVPLLLVTAQPRAPTGAFAHVLSNSKKIEFKYGFRSHLSYFRSEAIIWLGTSTLINSFRENTLGLPRLPILHTIFRLNDWGVPQIGLWSPIVAPKSLDWGSEISVAGYSFADKSQPYDLEPNLKSFLRRGDPPVYIGFGSMPIRDPKALTSVVLSAIRLCGVRAVLCKGKAGLGAALSNEIPETVFVANEIPHSALLPHVSAMVHHGGAGTVAAQLSYGKPAVIVPFFGDQHLWGNRLFVLGLGPRPISITQLTADNLAEALLKILETGNKYAIWTREISGHIETGRDGAEGVVELFQAIAADGKEACKKCPELPAVWEVTRNGMKLSALAAFTLVNENKLQWKDLQLHLRKEWNLFSWWTGYVERMIRLVLVLFLIWSVSVDQSRTVICWFVLLWLLSIGSGSEVKSGDKNTNRSVAEGLIRKARIDQGRYDFNMTKREKEV